ncbi:MAG: OmpA family protein [Nitrospirae bacterium]|nr:OmpA family protein [Nitrospirota bacterium]MDE3041586.1 OmpA family protein [Nitrospirota bacterium]MDE3051041.1 OmpA family protein [Nitrospirota bacterium]MDE3219643.1 OmpA family protein [Nitrospirota bacterium]
MRGIKTAVLTLSLLAFTGTAGAVEWTAICCDGGYEYRHPSAYEKEQQRLKDAMAAGGSSDTGKAGAELAAANRRIADLEKQLADRDRELAGLRSEYSDEMAKLKVAERGVVKGLRPQIEKGDITVDANSERLLINLASGYLFGSGEDALKPEGAEALKHVGSVLKDFPQYKVAVDGHTDNVPIHGALTTRFPTNKELSEARAVSAAKALADGGRADAVTTGYGGSKPVESNSTAEGRAKNRRVEVRVTK